MIGIALYNVLTVKRLGNTPRTDTEAMISILVPARNEALNIAGCLESLLQQDYQHYEVIVLDDESEDRTPEILKQIGERNTSLKVLMGEPLPAGWRGKNWACHQLSQAAQGEYLLFVDADTRHQPAMLSSAVAMMHATQADLLSGLPRQEMKTWGERLVLPVLSWAVLSFFPVHLFHRSSFSSLSIAVGQFLLFRRSAYLQIGGHSEIRSSVVEDMALARLARKNKMDLEFVNLNGLVYCRMYEDFGQVLDGLSKNLFALFGNNLPFFLFVWFWLALVFLLPLSILTRYYSGSLPTGYSPSLAAAAVGLSLCSWLIGSWYNRNPIGLAFAYPLIIILTVLIAVRSAWFHFSRRTLYWKGRALSSPKKDVDH